jgi:ribosomal-protein-alanine acetyltransferase
MPASRPRKSPDAALQARAARADDLDAIAAVEAAAFDERDRFTRGTLRRIIASPAAQALVVAENDRILGYAAVLFRSGARVARLYTIAVDPKAAGRGVGAALLAAAAKAALRRGADRLRLEVRSSNAAARRLYERAGFTRLDERPGYYDDGEAAVRYEKPLTVAGDRSAHP